MTSIRIKSSTTQSKVPVAGDLATAELALNVHESSMAVYTKDRLGAIRLIGGSGEGAVGDLGFWTREGTDLYPVNGGTDSLKLGGTLPAAPNITLNADGSGVFAGTVLSQNLLYAAKENTYVYPGGSGMSRNDLRDNATLRLANNDITTQGTASIVAIQGKGSNPNSGYSFLSFVTPSNSGGNYISLASTIQGSTTANETIRIGSTGDVSIGGTLPSAPNITLAADAECERVGLFQFDRQRDHYRRITNCK